MVRGVELSCFVLLFGAGEGIDYPTIFDSSPSGGTPIYGVGIDLPRLVHAGSGVSLYLDRDIGFVACG